MPSHKSYGVPHACPTCGVETSGRRFCSRACQAGAAAQRADEESPTPEEIAAMAADIKAKNLAAMQATPAPEYQRDLTGVGVIGLRVVPVPRHRTRWCQRLGQ